MLACFQSNMDVIEFQRTEDYYTNEGADYSVNSLVQIPTYPHLVEYRVKLLTIKQTFNIAGGTHQTIPTSALVKQQLHKFSGHIKLNENIPLACESEGYICPGFRGRIFLKVFNFSSNSVVIPPGACIGYIHLSPTTL